MSKTLQKRLGIPMFIFLLVAGCGQKRDMSLPLGPEIPEATEFEGVNFIDKEHGISFKYYPEYKETHRDEKGIILSKGGGTRVVMIVWPLDLDTYEWYVDAFAHPSTLKERLQKELLVKDKTFSYRVLEKEGADSFLFTTKTPSGFYNQRLEIFPKKRPLQISFLFQHEEENDPEVLNMIAGIEIVESSE